MTVDQIVRRAALAALGTAPGVALAALVVGWSTIVVAGAVAAAAVIVTTVIGTRTTRISRLAAVLAAGTPIVAAVVAAGAPTRTDGDGVIASMFDALAYGWSASISSPTPADPTARLLVPLAVVVWAATGAATELTRRAETGSTGPVTALSPLIAGLVAAVVTAGREQFHPVVVGAAVAGVAAVHLASFRPAADARARPAGRAASAPLTQLGSTQGRLAATLAVAVVGGVAAGPALAADRQPFDPRDRIDPVTVPSDAENPLDLFASRQLAGDAALFTVRSSEPLLTRVITLDTFDGARWSTSGGFEPTGTSVAGTSRSGVATRSVEAQVEVQALTGPWLPVAGDVHTLEGVVARVSFGSSSFLHVGGDVTGLEYRFEADVVENDIAALASLPVATDAAGAMAAGLPPGVPPPLIEMAAVATEGATTPFAQAVLLERYLRLNFDRDELVTAGHSFGHLLTALLENGAGTDEQFAAAFAVLGRIVGLPTRVVVGFEPGARQDDGSFVVRSGDARVWPEVRFAGAGWTAFDPTPDRDDDTTPIAIGPGGDDGFAVEQAANDPGLDADRPPPLVVTPTPPTDWTARAVTGALLLASVAVIAAVAVVAVKRQRTATRRNAATADERVVGAWADVLERFAEIDGRAPQTRTVEQLVDHGEETTHSLTGLYRPVSRALYDRHPCDDVDVEQAWRARDRFVKAMRRDAGPLRAIGWTLDPRPMVDEARRRRHHHARLDAADRSRA